jgi:hypothetical protein
MRVLDLNEDILLEIMEYLDPEAIWRLRCVSCLDLSLDLFESYTPR